MTAEDLMRSEGLARLKSRVARIQRLLNADAPVVILANEATLIGDCARMLSPRLLAEQQISEHISQGKRELGLCQEPDCVDHVMPRGPWQGQLCITHAILADAEHDDIERDLAQQDAEESGLLTPLAKEAP